MLDIHPVLDDRIKFASARAKTDIACRIISIVNVKNIAVTYALHTGGPYNIHQLTDSLMDISASCGM